MTRPPPTVADAFKKSRRLKAVARLILPRSLANSSAAR